MKRGISRREFVKLSATGAIALAAGGCRRRTRKPPSLAPAAAPAAAHRYFPALEFATLVACCGRLLPKDEAPGAVEMGAPEYMDRMFSSADRPVWHLIVRRGLGRLAREAKGRFARPFHEATAAEQDALLGEFQQREGRDRIFFHHLLAATLEGAFSHPQHGGNRDGAGWKLMGVSPDPCAPFAPQP